MQADKEFIDYVKRLRDEYKKSAEEVKPHTEGCHRRTFYSGARSAIDAVLGCFEEDK